MPEAEEESPSEAEVADHVEQQEHQQHCRHHNSHDGGQRQHQGAPEAGLLPLFLRHLPCRWWPWQERRGKNRGRDKEGKSAEKWEDGRQRERQIKRDEINGKGNVCSGREETE